MSGKTRLSWTLFYRAAEHRIAKGDRGLEGFHVRGVIDARDSLL